jgi:hypothetical protein
MPISKRPKWGNGSRVPRKIKKAAKNKATDMFRSSGHAGKVVMKGRLLHRFECDGYTISVPNFKRFVNKKNYDNR